MTLDEWDAKIAPVLRELETRAAFIEVKARSLEWELKFLEKRPAWGTKFEEQLNLAINKLHEIRQIYMEKSVE